MKNNKYEKKCIYKIIFQRECQEKEPLVNGEAGRAMGRRQYNANNT